MDDIVKLAKARLEKAYATLGARPGPGYDISITPTNPISDNWIVSSETQFGGLWMIHIYGETWIKMNNSALAKLKAKLADWQGSCFTDWSCVRTERVDP